MTLIDTVRPQPLCSKAAPLVGYNIDLTTIYFSGRGERGEGCFQCIYIESHILISGTLKYFQKVCVIIII